MASPQEVIKSANKGDTVKVTLRGPASDDEKEQLKAEYEDVWVGVNFIIEDGGVVSAAEIVNTNG